MDINALSASTRTSITWRFEGPNAVKHHHLDVGLYDHLKGSIFFDRSKIDHPRSVTHITYVSGGLWMSTWDDLLRNMYMWWWSKIAELVSYLSEFGFVWIFRFSNEFNQRIVSFTARDVGSERLKKYMPRLCVGVCMYVCVRARVWREKRARETVQYLTMIFII